MKHGKKYVDSAKLVDRSNLYDINQAMDLTMHDHSQLPFTAKARS